MTPQTYHQLIFTQMSLDAQLARGNHRSTLFLAHLAEVFVVAGAGGRVPGRREPPQAHRLVPWVPWTGGGRLTNHPPPHTSHRAWARI